MQLRHWYYPTVIYQPYYKQLAIHHLKSQCQLI